MQFQKPLSFLNPLYNNPLPPIPTTPQAPEAPQASIPTPSAPVSNL